MHEQRPNNDGVVRARLGDIREYEHISIHGVSAIQTIVLSADLSDRTIIMGACMDVKRNFIR